MEQMTRRRFLWAGLAVAAAAGAVWVRRNPILRWILLRNHNDALRMTAAPSLEGGMCVLTSRQVEGPFFIAAPHRRDLKEDRVGKDMTLAMRVVRMPDCTPVAGAIVEIWQCDAEGIYSGYPDEIPHDLWRTLLLAGTGEKHVPPVNEARFLRGAQLTDSEGRVTFDTIFPGWYEPRTPHIHFKILAGENELLTSQFYFHAAFSNRVYRAPPYSRFGASPYTPENDVAIHAFPDAQGLRLDPRWSDDGPLQATTLIGIAAG